MNQPCAATSSPRFAKFPWVKLVLTIALVIIATSASVAALYLIRSGALTRSTRKPTSAISRTCGKTRYPDICVESLVEFPGALSAGESDLVHMSVNLTLQRFERALSLSSKLVNLDMDSHVRSAYADCIELLQDSYEHLLWSLASIATSPNDHNVGTQSAVGSVQDVHTWLSATLTNQDTCDEGLREVKGSLKDQMEDKLQNLWELASNSLAIYLANKGDNNYFSGIPIQKTCKRLTSSDSEIRADPGHRQNRQMSSHVALSRRPVKEAVPEKNIEKNMHFPVWMNGRDRALMDLPAAAIYADIVVVWDGSGDCKTIAEAILKAPEKSDRRIIIYVKAGKYEEDNLNVGRKKTNLMFIGDGTGKTVITGHKNAVEDNITTFRTASFAVTGYGFIARDITFENYAGPSNHQAVALRMGADHAVVYRCEVLGYQDTLYVHSQRQFYRECDIYGTMDFIFGNAAVVFQNCNIYARKPMPGQKNTITAQNRKDPDQNTGISIQACKILAAPDLEVSKDTYPTFLGRPWKMYSRTVYMLSYMGDHISPKGWLEWNDAFALDTLFYGEYMNNGPGADVSDRVTWHGYRVMNSSTEATPFTVASLIYGLSWLPSTGVPFLGCLTN